MSIDASNELPYTGIVTMQEFLQFMNNMNLNANQAVAAAKSLRATQLSLETRLNRKLELTQVREYLTCDFAGYLNPSVVPIVKVISRMVVAPYTFQVPDWREPYNPPPVERDPLIGDNGRVVDTTVMNQGAPYVVSNGIYVGGIFGQLFYVEYVGGMDGTQLDDVKQAIMEVAARSVTHRHDDTLSLRQGNAEETDKPDPLPEGWTDAEIAALSRYRRRVIA